MPNIVNVGTVVSDGMLLHLQHAMLLCYISCKKRYNMFLHRQYALLQIIASTTRIVIMLSSRKALWHVVTYAEHALV